MSAEMSADPPFETHRLLSRFTYALGKALHNGPNAGGGTRTRTGIALRCLRPLRLPFRHSGPEPTLAAPSRPTLPQQGDFVAPARSIDRPRTT